MKKLTLSILLLLLLPTIFAINLEVTQKTPNQVIIGGLNQPAIVELEITNLGSIDNFEILNLFGFTLNPTETGFIKNSETKKIYLEVYPRSDFSIKGYYTLSYLLKSKQTSKLHNQELTLKIVDLGNAFEVGIEGFDLDANEIEIYFKNKENFNFQDLSVKFTSNFFKSQEEFDLNPNEKKVFNIELDKDDFKRLNAGFYTLTAEISVENQKAEVEGIINFKQNPDLKTHAEKSGFFIYTSKVQKENTGNIITKTQIELNKNIFSRLFTTFNVEPDLVKRNGIKINYTWEKSVKPGETFEVVAKTNFLFPVIIISLIVILIITIQHYLKCDIVIKKRINFVHTKNKQFALKVNIMVRAQNYVEQVNILDRLPLMVKLYSKFGGQEPTRANEEKRRIEWNFEKLEKGEVRTMSYVIYSKVGVFGKFALPKTTAIYEKEGELKETASNQVYFMSEEAREQ
ncbi:hypothetical protein HN832_03620 [archaeon]|jgi:hypothetical protein|nr:hypothetical protein [archaeon]MBT4373515.1 hypothetical protein [archaeon]MBT4531963.1 hypothetical protein [archaeon]MBT7001630.1 hypothetical protein [archaeon]MBT7282478.1 hypothetical protein [archaeon]